MIPSPDELMVAIVEEIRETCGGQPVVVAFSGGLDSTTVAALAKGGAGSAERPPRHPLTAAATRSSLRWPSS